jgi:hypothetical protein
MWSFRRLETFKHRKFCSRYPIAHLVAVYHNIPLRNSMVVYATFLSTAKSCAIANNKFLRAYSSATHMRFLNANVERVRMYDRYVLAR